MSMPAPAPGSRATYRSARDHVLASEALARPGNGAAPAHPAAEPVVPGPVRPVGPPAGDRQARSRALRLRQELLARASVSLLILLFNNQVAPLGPRAGTFVSGLALVGLLVNGPYYLAARSGRALRLQAYVRMIGDVLFLTAGLYAAGGLAAAPFVGVYAMVSVYTAIVFSSRACLVATALGTASYLLVAGLQTQGVLPVTRAIMPDAWSTAGFNLLVLNVVGAFAAMLAEAYRRRGRRLVALHDELERAHDESMRLGTQIQQAARRQALAEVVAGVTHELRNALQGVFGHLWLARQRLGDIDPEVTDHLRRVEHCCETAIRIARTTLDMARQPSAERAPVGLAEAARRVAELKAYDLRRARVTLDLQFPPDLPWVPGGPFQVEQVLLNLVNNAQDALQGAAGRRAITMVGFREPGGVAVEVRDSGPGLALSVLPHVFEPFYTTKGTGTGLGLAISAGIVESMGDRLTAGNRVEGGAVFRMSLPAEPAPA